MKNLQVIELNGQRVLTTSQLAKSYGTARQVISNNYARNRGRYTVGKHFILLEGQSLKEFKASHQFDDNLKYAHTLYLWTEKGALLHAKSLNTDRAWEVYDWLVDFYFRVKEQPKQITSRSLAEVMKAKDDLRLDIPNHKELQKKLQELDNLCVALRCVMLLYNRYLEPERAQAIQETLYSIGAEICSEAFRLKSIKIDKLVKV